MVNQIQNIIEFATELSSNDKFNFEAKYNLKICNGAIKT